MVIYITQGQLGNQIFQYSFLRNYAEPNEPIVSLGFDDLFDVFEKDSRVINIPKNKITRYLKVFKYVLGLLAELRLITYYRPGIKKVKVGYLKEDVQITKREGVLGWIKYVKTASYESEIHFPERIKTDLKIREVYLSKAHNFLKNIDSENKVFVHIRLGDYNEYTALGKSVQLPLEYYQSAIEEVKDKIEDVGFIFLSNDPNTIKKQFSSLKSKIISQNDFGTDFTIMTLCNYGILSASTFGFWGAYLMQDRKEVFAPKYWKGFNSGIEYPIKGFPSFATPIEVGRNK